MKWLLNSMMVMWFTSLALGQPTLHIVDSAHIENTTGLSLYKISFRGISVPNNKTIWCSGSKGVIAISNDGGENFIYRRVQGYDSSDFRDIHAFSDKVAIIMSSGTPSVILRTHDGGLSWKKVFEDRNPKMFLDAMDFWNDDEGMVIGDPIDQRFVLYRTIDGGSTWHPMDTSMRPWAIEGESLFAASGSCFRCMPGNRIAFVTGGSKAIFHWLEIDKRYQRFELKSMKQGSPSQGAFSFDYNKNTILVVGGDYASDTAKVKQSIYSYTYSKDGLELMNMKPFFTNYRSAVAFTGPDTFISCGTQGVDYNSTDQTITTYNQKTRIAGPGFHTIGTSPDKKKIALAGPKGMIGVVE